MNQFNQAQQEAITTGDGPVLVIAGAGTGKTSVLTNRLVYLVNELGFNPNRILALTFTNKAATEMRERISTLTQGNMPRWIGTFHSTCLRILREDIDKLDYEKNFNIVDQEDQITLLKMIYKELKFDSTTISYKNMLNHISTFKTSGLTPDNVVSETYWAAYGCRTLKFAVVNKHIYQKYLTYMKEAGSLDFDDLLLLAHQLLEENEVVRIKWQKHFDYVLIDEFQDTNDIQYDIVKILVAEHQNVFAVGDPDQMIYTWRGANIDIINNFVNVFKGAKMIILNKNYRSTQKILDASNRLIANNQMRIKKSLETDNGEGDKPLYYVADNQDAESNWIVKRINEYLDKGVEPRDISILYRSNFLSRNIEQALILEGVPYFIYGGFKFYQRKEIKDVLAYLKVINNNDVIGLRRIINTPRRRISDRTVESLTNYGLKHGLNLFQTLQEVMFMNDIPNVTKNALLQFSQMLADFKNFKYKSILELVDYVLKQTMYIEFLKNAEDEDRIENIDELKNAIAQYQLKNQDCTLDSYLQEIMLYTSFDENNKASKESVSLMTVHVAKGLEFPYVFILGFNDMIFPSQKSLLTPGGLEEERRIAYVAMTRAKQKLIITCANGYNVMSKTNRIPSRFVGEINFSNLEMVYDKVKTIVRNDLDWYDSQKSIPIPAENNYHHEKTNFKVGDVVIHTAFGKGVIMAVIDDFIEVSFKPPYNVKTLLSTHKSISRVLN